MPVLHVHDLINNRVEAIRALHREVGNPKAELDLSGGIDSAVMAGLLVLAQGAENVTLVHSRISTNPEQTQRAQALAKGFGARLVDIDLGDTFTRLLARMLLSLQSAGYDILEVNDRLNADPTILGSLRSTLRAPVGRGFNRLTGGGIRHGTGNECEDRFLRYFQKGGDGEVDTNPIEMLSKTEVGQVAFGLIEFFPDAAEALRAVIAAVPSADLWAGAAVHTDEGELQKWLGVPFTYGRVDPKTGEILAFGTIERVARFLDCRFLTVRVSNILFGETLEPWVIERLISEALYSGFFTDFHRAEVEALLLAARRAEKATRHKSNENIPILGSRDEMVREGLLTNRLISYTID